jgi:hypothetical protein
LIISIAVYLPRHRNIHRVAGAGHAHHEVGNRTDIDFLGVDSHAAIGCSFDPQRKWTRVAGAHRPVDQL